MFARTGGAHYSALHLQADHSNECGHYLVWSPLVACEKHHLLRFVSMQIKETQKKHEHNHIHLTLRFQLAPWEAEISQIFSSIATIQTKTTYFGSSMFFT